MDLPPLHSTEGAYWYLISLIVLAALVGAGYLAAVLAGLAPDPTRLIAVGPPLRPSVGA